MHYRAGRRNLLSDIRRCLLRLGSSRKCCCLCNDFPHALFTEKLQFPHNKPSSHRSPNVADCRATDLDYYREVNEWKLQYYRRTCPCNTSSGLLLVLRVASHHNSHEPRSLLRCINSFPVQNFRNAPNYCEGRRANLGSVHRSRNSRRIQSYSYQDMLLNNASSDLYSILRNNYVLYIHFYQKQKAN